MKDQKGQILLVVFMLLLFSSIILGGVVMLWRSSLNTTGLQKDSLAAFYFAQAGLERAYAEIAYWGSISADKNEFGEYLQDLEDHSPFSGVFAGGNYSLEYLTPPGGGAGGRKVTLTSTGRKGSSVRTIKQRLFLDISGVPPFGNAWGFWRKILQDCVWEEQ